jgi:hypothetical protein
MTERKARTLAEGFDESNPYPRKIPNHKFQITNKFQVPNSNVQNKGTFAFSFFVWVIGLLGFVICLLFGAWYLEFNVGDPPDRPYIKIVRCNCRRPINPSTLQPMLAL